MSKILFVDDEITKNIPSLERLFSSVISKDEHIKLAQLQRDPLFASISKIKDILKDNPVLEVENTFSGAITKIKEAGNGHEYDLFLLDRNLTGNGMYKLKDIASVMPGFDKNALERYQGREGDFLLLMLHLQGIPCREKVYFYSAYQTDEIRSALYLHHMIGFKTFSEDNFVDRSDSAAKDKFRTEVIEHLERAMIVARYREAFSGLRKADMDNEDRERLIDILSENSMPTSQPRVLLEHFLDAVQHTMKNYTWKKPDDNMDFSALRYKNTERGPQIVPQFVFNHCMSIKLYCNHYSSHKSNDAPGLPKPTLYSWLAIKFMLVEIFTWLDNELK